MGTNTTSGPGGTCQPGINKKSTTLCLMAKRSNPVRPAWSDHPSYITGMEALEDFHEWVARIVLPIAFQWIQENYDAVYDRIDPDKRDDVGVVIATAYEMIQDLEGCQKYAELMENLASGKVQEPDISTLNPVWTTITNTVRAASKQAFVGQEEFLDDTIPSRDSDPD